MKKARAHKSIIKSFKKWRETEWIETIGSERLWVQPSPLEARHKTYYDFHQLKVKYDEYVIDQLHNQRIESLYELCQKGYECTTNSWGEVDSLGVTIHPETEGIWSESYCGKNANEAKFKFSRYHDIPYEEVKARRNPVKDLWILKNNPYSQVLCSDHIRLMLNSTGNEMGKPFTGYRNRYQAEFSEFWESMISIGIAYKIDHQGLNFYALNDMGLAIVKLMLPTNNRKIHSANLEFLLKNFK